MTREEAVQKALDYFHQGYACSQSVLLAFAEPAGIDPKIAKLVASTFGGGMGRLRSKCGAITGGFMVLGLMEGYDQPNDMDTKLAVYKRVRELNKRVEDKFGCTNCNELLVKYSTPAHVQERSHHKDICGQVIAHAAGELYDMLHEKGEI